MGTTMKHMCHANAGASTSAQDNVRPWCSIMRDLECNTAFELVDPVPCKVSQSHKNLAPPPTHSALV